MPRWQRGAPAPAGGPLARPVPRGLARRPRLGASLGAPAAAPQKGRHGRVREQPRGDRAADDPPDHCRVPRRGRGRGASGSRLSWPQPAAPVLTACVGPKHAKTGNSKKMLILRCSAVTRLPPKMAEGLPQG